MIDQSIDPTIQMSNIFENPQLSNWEEITRKMLKVDDLDRKLLFKSIEGFELFPLQTHTDFICELSTFPQSVEIDQNIKSESCDIDLSLIHNAGASIVQELSFGINEFIKAIENKKTDIKISLSLDSLYFANIAKLRALRFLLERINEESEHKLDFKIYTFNSLREQTLFDPWVNMLRNVTSSMAAIIGGADFINSLSYDSLFSNLSGQEQMSLGLRQSLNHLKILLEESHLSQVKDYSKGSYLIEHLTENLISLSFKMGKSFTGIEAFAKEVEEVSNKRHKLARSRKITITGINNFANPDETIENIYTKKIDLNSTSNSKNNLFPLRFVSSEFDKLRSQFNKDNNPVTIVLFGSEAKLSGRSNFCQNYFEVLGAKVSQVQGDSEIPVDHHIIICSDDDSYNEKLGEFIAKIKPSKPKSIYLAGKFEHSNSEIKDCLFMGQDIYKTLSEFIQEVC